MKILNYYIVDVFAEQKYQGNQLAVFLDTKGLSKEEMQSIALETNFSETTFIESSEKVNGGYNVRIFTPDTEVPFAGHPTLGTAFVISNYIDKTAQTIALNYPVGQIPVSIHKKPDGLIDVLWMQQINPEFGDQIDHETAAKILGIPDSSILNDFPVIQVSTGLPFYIVPLDGLESVRRIAIDLPAYLDFSRSTSDSIITPAFLTFCKETYHRENQINCRMHYMENNQIVEDSATGSANGCLLSYLLKFNYFNSTSLDLKVEQGFEINRPSLIFHKGERLNEMDYEIHIGGHVQVVSKGEWFH